MSLKLGKDIIPYGRKGNEKRSFNCKKDSFYL